MNNRLIAPSGSHRRKTDVMSKIHHISAARDPRMSAQWCGPYDTGAAGALGLARPARRGLAAAVRGVVRGAIQFACLLVAAGIAFGVMDAVACGDTAGAAEAKAFAAINDFIVDGCRAMSLKLISSLDLLNAVDAAAQATGYCVATLLAKGAAVGALACGVLIHLVHP
jgi:hypothetical protein